MKKVLFFWLILVQTVSGQDPQFTQFYAAPMYHNPAFTGSGYAPRVMMNYRNQWPSLNANFVTSLFTLDHYLERVNSGIGISLLSDKQGYNLTNTEVRLLYSYELRIDRDNALRFGLNGGYSFRGINTGGLIFGDQLDNNGQVTGPSTDPILNRGTNAVNSLDVGAGILYFNPKYFIGASMNHLTEPQLTFFDNPTGAVPNLPRQLIVNGGYNVDLSYLITDSYSDREFTLTPTFLYKKQGAYSQLDLGAYVTYSPLTLGLQYRGIPLTKVFNNFPNQDAISGVIGVRYENFSFGYSYDLTVSGLGSRSGGSHEISIAYQLPQIELDRKPRHKSRKKILSCPKF